MDVGAALVAHRQTAEALEPGEGAFDHPALATQSRLPFAALGDGVPKMVQTTEEAIALAVVGFIGMKRAFTSRRWEYRLGRFH